MPSGSSPRGRGKPGQADHRELEPGLIPARAGKTSLRDTLRAGYRAHPRAGGENPPGGGLLGQAAGSSPRGRGKLAEGKDSHLALRLIPARAGKTRPAGRVAGPVQAHPRAGGENRTTRTIRIAFLGSSPRGRGKLRQAPVLQGRGRLIPARAGKTPSTSCLIARAPAHPRAGGENGPARRPDHVGAGSSPRGRGKRPGWARRGRTRGLIPARAGKTVLVVQAVADGAAHPRAGGENDR